SGRFEMKSFVGKKLLAGRDVPGDFLSLKGAGALKKLTGGDLITVESKGKDERSEIKGKFNIIITSNTRLSLTIEGDRSAWERRLLVIPFEREPVAKPIPNFGEQLVEEEGEGILAWMVEGAQKLLSDLGECGRIRLDAVQRKRVSDLLAESDSVTTFVAGRVVRETGARAATSRLFEAYTGFCFNRDMPTVSRKQFERHVGAEMRRIHHASPSENILTGEDRSRGYLGVRLLRDSEEDIDVAE
ncbi:MAG TPA: hypothetical protein PLA50_15285, partial [Bacteroidia bacterium]|nr:hypothetical protein [Bacteroidia bacterium]